MQQDNQPAYTFREQLEADYRVTITVASECNGGTQLPLNGYWAPRTSRVLVVTNVSSDVYTNATMSADHARRLAASLIAAADQCERWERQ